MTLLRRSTFRWFIIGALVVLAPCVSASSEESTEKGRIEKFSEDVAQATEEIGKAAKSSMKRPVETVGSAVSTTTKKVLGAVSRASEAIEEKTGIKGTAEPSQKDPAGN